MSKRLMPLFGLVPALTLNLPGAGSNSTLHEEDQAVLALAGQIALPGVEGRIDHLTFDSRGKRLFVAALENNSVEVVNLNTRHVQTIPHVPEPQGVAFLPKEKVLLVCSRGDGTCRSFDADTFEAGPWVDLGRNADNLRFDAESEVVLVGSGGEPGNGLLSAVNLRVLLPEAKGGVTPSARSPADFFLSRPRQSDPVFEMQLPAHPESFQVDAASHRVFVNVPDERKIFVLGMASNRFAQVAAWPVTVGERNFPMALDSTGKKLFVACRNPPVLAVYDTESGRLLSQATCVGDADDMFLDRLGKHLYVVGGDGFVDVFDVQFQAGHPVLLAHVPTAARARTGFYDPESRSLFIAAPHTGNSPAAILQFTAKW